MARTEEQVNAILNDIDGALRTICPESDQMHFNRDPEQAAAEKLLMFYYMSTTPVAGAENRGARMEDIRDIANRVMLGEDDFCKYAMALQGDARDKMMRELAAAQEPSRLEQAVRAQAAAHNVVNNPTQPIEAGIRDMFAPELPQRRELRNNVSGMDAEQLKVIKAADKESRSIKLDVPVNMESREVALAAIGNLFLSDNMRAAYVDIKRQQNKLPDFVHDSSADKKLPLGVMELEAREHLIKNLFSPNPKTADELVGRLAVNKARKDMQEDIRYANMESMEYVAGDLQTLVLAGIDNARMTKDIQAPENTAMLALALEADTMLKLPAYVGAVKWDKKDRARIDTFRKEFELIQEAAKLKEEILDYAQKNYENTLPADKPEIMEKLDKWGKLQVGFEYIKQSAAEHRDYVVEIGGKAKANYLTKRPMDEYESGLLENNAYSVFYGDKFRKSDFRKACAEAKTGEDLFKAFGKPIAPNEFFKEGVLNIGYATNNTLKNVCERITDVFDSKADMIKDIARAVTYGAEGCSKEAAEFADKEPALKRDPTPAELERKRDYLYAVSKKLTEKYPNGILTVDKRGNDVDLVSQLRMAVTDSAKRIDQYLKNVYPDRETALKINQVFTMTANARKNGDSLTYMDETGRKLSTGDAAGRLFNGQPVQVEKFEKGHFIGVRQPMSLGQDGKLVFGKASSETLLRTADCKVKDATAANQLETVKYIKEALDKTQSFFVKNSKEFNTLMKSLTEVVKAQENIGENPNIRQIKTLNEMYDKLNKDAQAYVNYKKPAVKDTDVRGKIRLAGIESLLSVTDPKYVRAIADRSYPEQKSMNEQMKEGRELISLMENLKEKYVDRTYIDIPARSLHDNEIEELDAGYRKVVGHITNRESEGKRNDYLALGMGDTFKEVKQLYDSVFRNPPDPAGAKRFIELCDKAAVNYAGMSPDIKPQPAKAAPRAEAPQVEAPQAAPKPAHKAGPKQ